MRWPQRMAAIADGVFWGCAAIVFLVLPPKLERIGDFAFQQATSLESVAFAADSRLAQIGVQCFAWSGLAHIDIPASVQEVGRGAFLQGRRLTVVTFAEGSKLTRVGKGAFANCSPPQVLQFAEGSNPEIGEGALKGCPALQVLRVPRAAGAQFAGSVPAGCRVELTL
jgi:hypothetical protein